LRVGQCPVEFHMLRRPGATGCDPRTIRALVRKQAKRGGRWPATAEPMVDFIGVIDR
jgi:hypothetical protein